MPKLAILKESLTFENTGIHGLALPAGTIIRDPEIEELKVRTVLGPTMMDTVVVTGANGKLYNVGEIHFMYSDLDEPYFLTDDAFDETRVIDFKHYSKRRNFDGVAIFASADAAANALLSRWRDDHAGLWDIRVRESMNKIVRILDFNEIVKPKRQYYFVRYQGDLVPLGTYVGYGRYYHFTVTGAENFAEEFNWKHGKVMEVVDRRLNVVKTVGVVHKGVLQRDIDAFNQEFGESDDDE